MNDSGAFVITIRLLVYLLILLAIVVTIVFVANSV